MKHSKSIKLAECEAALVLRADGNMEVITPTRTDRLTRGAVENGQLDTADHAAMAAYNAVRMIEFMATCQPLLAMARAMIRGDVEAIQVSPGDLAAMVGDVPRPSGDPKEWN